MVTPANVFTTLSVSLSSLQELTQQLAANLPEPRNQREPFHVRSPQPWLPPVPQTSEIFPCARIVSAHPISALPVQGQTCRLVGTPLQGIQPLTHYVFPLLVWQLIAPDGQHQTVETEIPPFRTYAEGNSVSHLLEYAATCLDLDLQPHGFRVRRFRKRLEIVATEARAGWNLCLSEQIEMPLPAHALRCHLGLQAGISTQDPGQTPGQFGQLWFGSYLLNGKRIDLQLTLNAIMLPRQVGEALVLQFNQLTPETGVQASLDADNHLVLSQIQVGPQHVLELKRLPEPPGLQDPVLDLGLPEGCWTGPDLETTQPLLLDLGAFKLNGQLCQLGEIQGTPVSSWLPLLTEKLEQFSDRTDVKIWLDTEGYLHFEGYQIVLEPGAGPWELEACELRQAETDWKALLQLFQDWISAANHCLRQVARNSLLKSLEIPLRQALLMGMPGQSGVQVSLSPESGFQLALKPEILIQHYTHTAPGFQRFLQTLPEALARLQEQLHRLEISSAIPAVVEPVPVQPLLMPLVVPENVLFKPIAPPAPLESEEEAQPSSFDHKI